MVQPKQLQGGTYLHVACYGESRYGLASESNGLSCKNLLLPGMSHRRHARVESGYGYGFQPIHLLKHGNWNVGIKRGTLVCYLPKYKSCYLTIISKAKDVSSVQESYKAVLQSENEGSCSKCSSWLGKSFGKNVPAWASYKEARGKDLGEEWSPQQHAFLGHFMLFLSLCSGLVLLPCPGPHCSFSLLSL